MVNAYMYQAAGTNGQAAPPPGQGPPNTSPPYSNYQPTPSQGYQVWVDTIIFLNNDQLLTEYLKINFSLAECGLSGPVHAPHVPGCPY